MVKHFSPSGKILEPCRGAGNILKHLPADTKWCEIAEGIDFYDHREPVDWIVTNPPFSHFSKFIKHGLTVSNNSVWLLPTWKIFSGFGMLKEIRNHGGIVHMRHYGTGTKLGWAPLGNSISAIHIQRLYKGDISQSWYEPNF